MLIMLRFTLNYLLKPNNLGSIYRAQLSSTSKDKWDIVTAVLLERKPIITPELNQLEKDYQKLLAEVEYERSLTSDFEVRHKQEQAQIDKLKKGEDVEVHFKETAQDLLDAYTDELKKFKFGSRITEADKTNDLKSLKRKLDKYLIFVVSQKVGKENFYLLPQGLWQNGETLRQTAERVLKETCGKELKAQFYGNAPSSFYKYKYPKSKRDETSSVGAKIFIYFARYKDGNVPNKMDFKWLDKNELEKTIPREYFTSVNAMLME